MAHTLWLRKLIEQWFPGAAKQRLKMKKGLRASGSTLP
jgi:hypothetical protein